MFGQVLEHRNVPFLLWIINGAISFVLGVGLVE